MVVSFAGYIIAYKTYGRYLAGRIFGIDPQARTPAHELRDEVDYMPAKKEVLFGHHFTSIAGVGPIVGPAIGIMYGWVPALLWIFLGSIFMGAVHDFSALVISVRNKGQSIGELTATLVNPRVRTLFLLIVFLALTIVLAVFCLVVAALFKMYPESVFPVWMEIPIALAVGYGVYKKGMNTTSLGIAAVILMYITVVIGALWLPLGLSKSLSPSQVIIGWTVILLAYGYIASILPVWRLLQPRDYINAYQLGIVFLLLVIGVFAARPDIVAPAVRWTPAGAKSLWLFPFMFIMIACGAISGFHSLVSSGTSSKQLDRETDAQAIGFGGMLTEAGLATLVLLAVGAGVGIATKMGDGTVLTGTAAWNARYADYASANALAPKVKAFVDGSANMLQAYHIPWAVAVGIMGVALASFAGTTLDSATRIQRYVVSELARGFGIRALTGKHAATAVAVIAAAALAIAPYKGMYGMGGMILWPLFGATNQLIAALALLVATVYLAKRGKPVIFTFIPMCIMLAITGTAMALKIRDFAAEGTAMLHLLIVGIIIVALQVWMIVEVIINYRGHMLTRNPGSVRAA